MKIKVKHKEGTWETITVEGDMEVTQQNGWDCIVTASGTEYFFTKDGCYEGWAGTTPSFQRAQDTTEEVEAGRNGVLVVRKWTSRIQ